MTILRVATLFMWNDHNTMACEQIGCWWCRGDLSSQLSALKIVDWLNSMLSHSSGSRLSPSADITSSSNPNMHFRIDFVG